MELPRRGQADTVALTERELLDLKLRAELEPANVSLLLEFAEACERAGLDADADHAYRRVLDVDPEHPAARRGRLRHFRRAYEAAAAHGNGFDRAAIVHQVGELGEPTATPWLVDLLRDDQPSVCQKAAEALGRLHDRAAVPMLLRLLRSDGACAWWQAAEALAAIGDRAAVPPLLQVLAFGSPNARAAAAHALGLLRDPAALEPLGHALSEDDAGVRRASAQALAQLGDLGAVPILAAALDDPDPETRAAVVEAMGTLVGRDFRGSLLRTGEQAARRWWEQTGRRRSWGHRLSAQAALAARRRRRARDARRALVVGAVFFALAVLGVAGLAVFLSLVLRLASH